MIVGQTSDYTTQREHAIYIISRTFHFFINHLIQKIKVAKSNTTQKSVLDCMVLHLSSYITLSRF